ncbi:MAG: bifunctional glycosyltransferase family 2/GtrA family protein [Oscillospiraceae bacterium]|nr:bifunctional glycosyltransferase family 2/GtrA family protein [Oscillospiraceae bacterium]
MDGIIAVIPSLNPDEKLRRTVLSLTNAGFTDIILVNDGSGAEHLPFFEFAPIEGVSITVLRHEHNLGKGAAMKTAFAYIADNKADASVVVTLDGDGQHTAQDTLAVARHAEKTGSVTLGVRDFDKPGVPKRSRIGNKFTRGALRIFGVRVSDTQTGLRGFPAAFLPTLLKIEGERFEYETNMLLALSRLKYKFEEVPIDTVYIDENASTHYRAFQDSIRILRITAKFAAFAIVSILSAVLDNALFYVFSLILSTFLGKLTTAAAFVCARILSSVFNYLMNRKFVFNYEGSSAVSAGRYFLLAAAMLLVGNGFVNLVVLPLELTPGFATLAKIVIDMILFCASYIVQKKWVFKTSNRI